MKIKQLEWDHWEHFLCAATKTAFADRYRIYDYTVGYYQTEKGYHLERFVFGWQGRRFERLGVYKTLDEAKQAAQKDFEERIKQCLE